MLKPLVKLRPEEKRQAMWAEIRKTDGVPFAASRIAREMWFGIDVINDYLRGLSSAGYLERTPPAMPGRCATYRLVRDTGAEAPRVRRDGSAVTQGRGREQMWRTMRILGEFTPRELAITASTEEIHIAPGEASSYVNRLYAAGYLRMTCKGKPGHKRGTGEQARYLFLRHMYTGPHAPQVQRDKRVYDPNLHRTVLAPGEGAL